MNTTIARWQRRKDARPAEIIQAAQQLFTENGYATTRLDDVARQAGISKGTLYLYFANKEDLFKAVVRETVLPNLEQAEQLVSEFCGSSADLLTLLLQNWTLTLSAEQNACISKLMIAEASKFPELARFYVEEVVIRSRALFASVLKRGMLSGEFRIVDIPLCTRTLIAPMLMLKVWQQCFTHHDPEIVDLAQFAQHHIDLLLNGLRPR